LINAILRNPGAKRAANSALRPYRPGASGWGETTGWAKNQSIGMLSFDPAALASSANAEACRWECDLLGVDETSMWIVVDGLLLDGPPTRAAFAAGG